MYNDIIRKTILDNLESKVISIADAAITLASQGYLLNRQHYIKLDWSSVLLHAFENIDILNEEQQRNIELIYNKIVSI